MSHLIDEPHPIQGTPGKPYFVVHVRPTKGVTSTREMWRHYTIPREKARFSKRFPTALGSLDVLPWVEVRPGVHRRGPLMVDSAHGVHRITAWDFGCMDCREKHDVFMVRDALFRSVCPDGGAICRPCFEQRIGRPLTADDLKRAADGGHIPANRLHHRDLTEGGG